MMSLLNYSDSSSEQYNNNNEYNFEDETRIKEPNDTYKYLIEMLELDGKKLMELVISEKKIQMKLHVLTSWNYTENKRYFH